MKKGISKRYMDFATQLSEIHGEIESIRTMMHYVNNAHDVEDEELPYYKLEEVLTALGSAIAATIVYADSYEKEDEENAGTDKK